MAGKKIDGLTGVSDIAPDDLLLVYDVDASGSEKSKKMTYADFHTLISGTVGGGGGDLVDDTSPQLGGDLDANGNVILLAGGSESAPGLAFGSSTGTGLWYDYKLHISHSGDEIIQMFHNSGQNVSYIMTEALPSNQDTADLVLKVNGVSGTAVAGDARLEGGTSSVDGTSGHAKVIGGNSVTGQAGDVVLTPGIATDSGGDGAVNITQTEAPPVTTDRLYNLAGDLTWNGKDLTSELYYAGDLKLATDSTGVAVIGDISCNDLYVSGNTIFVGTGEIKSTAGNVELNYSGSKVVETIATGLQAGVSTFDIKTSGGEDGITINNDGAVELFYNNIKALETIAGGISVFDTNGDDPNIRFYSDAASLVGEIKIINGDMKLDVGFATYIDIASGGAVSLYYDEEKRFETTSSGATVTGDLQLTGVMDADSLDYAKVGTPTYSTGQEAMDQLGSAGVISGGVISEDSTAQVSITAGTGLIRTSNSDNAPIVFIDWSGTSLHIPEDADKAIVVKYNAGSPAVFAEDPANVNTNNMIVLGEVETLDGALFFSNTRQRAGNFNAKLLERLYDTTPVVRANHSGLILGDSADNNRYVTMTAGDVWNLLELDSIAAIDTGVTDEYTRYWSDGGVGWNTLIGQTIWPNAQYDNGTGTLASLASDRYTSLWFYLIPSDNTLHMLYGVTNDKNLAVAEAEPAPNDLPVILREFSVLIGRFIIKGSLTLATEVQTAFDDTINLTASTNHSNLSNLDVDDHTQYSLVTGARDFTGTVGGVDPVAATDFVTLQYMATLGTDRTRLTYDGTTDLDISIEHIVDIKYADFQPGLDAPPWQEGRVF